MTCLVGFRLHQTMMESMWCASVDTMDAGIYWLISGSVFAGSAHRTFSHLILYAPPLALTRYLSVFSRW